MSKLYTDVWKEALENLSGKTITGKYTELAELISAFNDLYKAKVTFTKTPTTARIVLKDSNGNVIGSNIDGSYLLKVGTYTYDAIADGYTPKTSQSLTIASGDITSGKTVAVTLTAVSD